MNKIFIPLSKDSVDESFRSQAHYEVKGLVNNVTQNRNWNYEIFCIKHEILKQSKEDNLRKIATFSEILTLFIST